MFKNIGKLFAKRNHEPLSEAADDDKASNSPPGTKPLQKLVGEVREGAETTASAAMTEKEAKAKFFEDDLRTKGFI